MSGAAVGAWAAPPDRPAGGSLSFQVQEGLLLRCKLTFPPLGPCARPAHGLYKKQANAREPDWRQLFLLELICLDSFNAWNIYTSILYKSKHAVSLAVNLSYDIITAGNL